jgi:hypothetical protein
MKTQTERNTENKRKYGILNFLVLLAAFIQIPAFAAQKVSLEWQPSTSSYVAGYKVYYGTVPGNYTNIVSVGNLTQATVQGLTEGVTYYFAVTAYDVTDLESDFSNEVSYSVPAPEPVKLQMQTVQQNGISSIEISATGTISSEWTLESSVDLKTWNTYTNGTGAINIQVPIGSEPNRFFRLKNQ